MNTFDSIYRGVLSEYGGTSGAPHPLNRRILREVPSDPNPEMQMDLREVFDGNEKAEGLVIKLTDLEDEPVDSLLSTTRTPPSLQKFMNSIEILPANSSWADFDLVLKKENPKT